MQNACLRSCSSADYKCSCPVKRGRTLEHALTVALVAHAIYCIPLINHTHLAHFVCEYSISAQHLVGKKNIGGVSQNATDDSWSRVTARIKKTVESGA